MARSASQPPFPSTLTDITHVTDRVQKAPKTPQMLPPPRNKAAGIHCPGEVSNLCKPKGSQYSSAFQIETREEIPPRKPY